MPITLRKFEAQVKDPDTGDMVPAGLLSSDALGAIDSAKTDAVTAIEGKQAVAEAAIELKGAETIASIPVDYTELSGEVDDLKTQFEKHADDFEVAMDGIFVPGSEVDGNIITVDSSAGEIEKITVDASGADTSVITRCGKNIFPKFDSGSKDGLSWTVSEDGELEFTGTPTADVLLRHRNLSVPTAGKAFALAANNTMAGSAAQLTIVCRNTAGNWQTNLTSINKTNTHAVYQIAGTKFTEFIIKLSKDIDWTGLKMKPMLVVGGTLGDFEAYNGQTYNVTLVDGVVQEDISLLDGTNTIWASNGDLAVQFRDTPVSVKDYVDGYVAGQVAPLKGSFYKITKGVSDTHLYMYFPYGNKVVRWELKNAPTLPASQGGSNSDTWQIGAVVGYDFDPVTMEMTNANQLVDSGEFEIAFKEYNTKDYCGGNNHGDENTYVNPRPNAAAYSASSAYAVGDFCIYENAIYRCTTEIGSTGEAWNADHWTIVVYEYSSTLTYNVGDYCVYDGAAYRCSTEISTAESWNAAHWTAATFPGTDVKYISVMIDGKPVDFANADGEYHPFDRIDAYELARINRCTDGDGGRIVENATDYIAEHQKVWVFKDGKVSVRQTLKLLQNVQCDFLCCMFAANRSAFPFGVRQGRWGVENMEFLVRKRDPESPSSAASSFPGGKVVTTGNEMAYTMYGANATAKISAKLCDHTPEAHLWINPAATVNKLYYNFYGEKPNTSVTAGTVLTWEQEYEIAYN